MFQFVKLGTNIKIKEYEGCTSEEIKNSANTSSNC